MSEQPAKEMPLEELMRAELIEACIDDGYGPRLRELREELIRRRRVALTGTDNG